MGGAQWAELVDSTARNICRDRGKKSGLRGGVRWEQAKRTSEQMPGYRGVPARQGGGLEDRDELSVLFHLPLSPIWASPSVKNPRQLKICLQCSRPRLNPWVGKIPWWRKWQPSREFLPGKSHGQSTLAAYSPWGHKGQT